MVLNVISFNESKTEVQIFEPGGERNAIHMDLWSLGPYMRSTVKHVGVIMHSYFKLDKQINSVIKSSFFQLRLLSKVKPILSFSDFERVIHAFISTRLDYCNAIYVGVNQASLSRLQLVQNAAVHLLTETRRRDHIIPVLAFLHWLPVRFRIDFKILLFMYKALTGLAPTYLSDLLKPYVPPKVTQVS